MKVRIKNLGPRGDQGYLTEGKIYTAHKQNTGLFKIMTDTGTPAGCKLKGCAHLGGGDWEIMEEAKDV